MFGNLKDLMVNEIKEVLKGEVKRIEEAIEGIYEWSTLTTTIN